LTGQLQRPKSTYERGFRDRTNAYRKPIGTHAVSRRPVSFLESLGLPSASQLHCQKKRTNRIRVSYRARRDSRPYAPALFESLGVGMPGMDALEHLTQLLVLGESPVERGASHKLLMGACSDDLPILKNDDQVAVDNGRQPVSNNEQGSVLSHRINRFA